jgi:hypothetical protein
MSKKSRVHWGTVNIEFCPVCHKRLPEYCICKKETREDGDKKES